MNRLPPSSTIDNPATGLLSKASLSQNEAADKPSDKKELDHTPSICMPHTILDNPKKYISSQKLTQSDEEQEKSDGAACKPCNTPILLKKSRPLCESASITHKLTLSHDFIPKEIQPGHSKIKIESTQSMIQDYWAEFLFLLATAHKLTTKEIDQFREIYSVDMIKLKQIKKYMRIKKEKLNDAIIDRYSKIFFTTIKSDFSDDYHDFVIKACYFNPFRTRKELSSEKMQQIICEFRQEISCLLKLNHEHIIELFGYHITDSYKNILSCFLICKRYAYDGTNFFNGQMTSLVRFKTMLFLASHIMQALTYLRTQRIIHGDIKLDNFFCNDSGDKWYLADFGLIKKANEEGYSTHFNISGTQGYLAPEIYCNKLYSHQSDIFAFGMSLLYLYNIQDPYSLDLPNAYAKTRYNNACFITNNNLSELYFKCSDALQLSPHAKNNIDIIMNFFKEKPESIAKTLWATYSSQVLHQTYTTENRDKHHMLALSVLMPSIITAAQKDSTKRGHSELFTTYFQSLLTQYHQTITPQDEQW